MFKQSSGTPATDKPTSTNEGTKGASTDELYEEMRKIEAIYDQGIKLKDAFICRFAVEKLEELVRVNQLPPNEKQILNKVLTLYKKGAAQIRVIKLFENESKRRDESETPSSSVSRRYSL